MRRSPNIRFRVDFGDELHVGPGKIVLLEAIADHGSLNLAAKAAGLSYRRAWLLLENLNGTFDRPVVESSIGGKHGGGSHVTDFGLTLIESYRRLEGQILHIGLDALREVLPHVSRCAPAGIATRQRLARKLVTPKAKRARQK